VIGFVSLLGRSYPGQAWIAKIMSKANAPLSLLMLRDQPLATFLFGFLAIALPCGQSLVVFSACALSGNLAVGLLNGFAFALLTSPSLFFAMHAHAFLGNRKKYWISAGNYLAIAVGAIAICRGLAELNLLPHLGLSLPFAETLHFVIY
jgi:sulfite exporter TauE/SafE